MKPLEACIERSLASTRKAHQSDALRIDTRMVRQHVKGTIDVEYEIKAAEQGMVSVYLGEPTSGEAIVVAVAFASPRKNCVSESVKVSIECSSVRAAISCMTGSALASSAPIGRPCPATSAANLCFTRSSLKAHLGPEMGNSI